MKNFYKKVLLNTSLFFLISAVSVLAQVSSSSVGG